MRQVIVALLTFIEVLPACACSVRSDWRPPTPQSAFDAAQVVLHARVLSQSGGDNSNVTVEVLSTLKGTFSGKTVKTGSGSMCGMQLVDGTDYVFFFPKGHGYFVSFVNQPDLTAAQILSLLPQTTSRNAVLAQVPETSRPSGQYFQSGYRGPTPPTTNDPDPVVNLQVDLATPANCETRLGRIAGSKEVGVALGAESVWCSAKSASKQLKFFGVFKNRTTGKSVQIESADIELCTAAVEALTGGRAPNNKIEVTMACQAK